MNFVIAIIHGFCPSSMFKGEGLFLIEMWKEHFTIFYWIFQRGILQQGKSILSDDNKRSHTPNFQHGRWSEASSHSQSMVTVTCYFPSILLFSSSFMILWCSRADFKPSIFKALNSIVILYCKRFSKSYSFNMVFWFHPPIPILV